MIVLCVTGSVAAASEAIKLAREFRRNDVEVKCFMSDAACELLHPNSMEFATGNEVVTKLTGNRKRLYTIALKNNDTTSIVILFPTFFFFILPITSSISFSSKYFISICYYKKRIRIYFMDSFF